MNSLFQELSSFLLANHTSSLLQLKGKCVFNQAYEDYGSNLKI